MNLNLVLALVFWVWFGFQLAKNLQGLKILLLNEDDEDERTRKGQAT